MSVVNQVVKEKILTQPNIFESRKEVLEYIFTKVNNGYFWNDYGEIVPESETIEKLSYWSPEKEISHVKNNNFPKFIEQEIMKKAHERIEKYSSIVNNVHNELKEINDDSEDSVMVNPNCLLCLMPDNASSEWRQAANEIFGNRKVVISE